MSQNGVEFDYETLLEECTIQDESVQKSQSQVSKVDEKYTNVLSGLRNAQKILCEKKDYNNKLRLLIQERLNIQTILNQECAHVCKKIDKVQEEISSRTADQFQTGFLQNMNELYTRYESIDTEFNDETLREKISEYVYKVEEHDEEQAKFENILRAVKDSGTAQSDYDWMEHPKQPVTLQEIVALFGYNVYNKQKIASIKKNIETLQKNMVDYNLQLL